MSDKKIMISLCAPPRCSCPTLKIDFDTLEVVIKDDYKGQVRMSLEDFTVLSRRFLTYV